MLYKDLDLADIKNVGPSIQPGVNEGTRHCQASLVRERRGTAKIGSLKRGLKSLKSLPASVRA